MCRRPIGQTLSQLWLLAASFSQRKEFGFTNSPKVQLPLLVAGHTTLSALAATLHWEKAGVVFAVACSDSVPCMNTSQALELLVQMAEANL